jgi:hypothetical protein
MSAMMELHFKTSYSKKQQGVTAVFSLHPRTDIIKIKTNYIPLYGYPRGDFCVVRLSKL